MWVLSYFATISNTARFVGYIVKQSFKFKLLIVGWYVVLLHKDYRLCEGYTAFILRVKYWTA
jgi:hypothetical protein